jgi:hypothetical protein
VTAAANDVRMTGLSLTECAAEIAVVSGRANARGVSAFFDLRIGHGYSLRPVQRPACHRAASHLTKVYPIRTGADDKLQVCAS